jgi:hypothetical protein
MTKRIIETVFAAGFAAALAFTPACDKGKDDKSAKAEDKKAEDEKKTDDKAEAKTEEKAEDKTAEAGAGDEKKDEVAEVDADARVDIIVDAGGYHPAEVRAPAKSKVTLAFTRTTDAGCGKELVVASMDLEKELPLNEAVEVQVEVPESGEVGFACGMNMYKGKVVPKS